MDKPATTRGRHFMCLHRPLPMWRSCTATPRNRGLLTKQKDGPDRHTISDKYTIAGMDNKPRWLATGWWGPLQSVVEHSHRNAMALRTDPDVVCTREKFTMAGFRDRFRGLDRETTSLAAFHTCWETVQGSSAVRLLRRRERMRSVARAIAREAACATSIGRMLVGRAKPSTTKEERIERALRPWYIKGRHPGDWVICDIPSPGMGTSRRVCPRVQARPVGDMLRAWIRSSCKHSGREACGSLTL